jgi:hypothetical protein
VQRSAEAEAREARLEIGEVALDDALHVDVRDGRRGALELADLGHDLARDRDAHVGRDGAHDLGRALLVQRVGEAVQERDRDRLDAGLGELEGKALDVQEVDLLLDRPVGERPLGDVEAQVTGHERCRQVDVEVVDLVAALARDLDRVAMPGGREQRRRRPLALDDRVRHERRPVHDALDLRDRDAVRLERLLQDRLDRARGLVRRRQRLADGDEAARADDAEVRERPPDVDADAQGPIAQASFPTLGYSS